MYCSSSPKATVTYNFNAGNQRTFYTEQTPIDIRIVEKWIPEFTGGQCPTVYNITYLEKNPYQNPEERQRTVSLYGAIEGMQYEFSFPGDDNYSAANGASARLVAYHGTNTGERTRTVILGNSGGILTDKSRYTSRILSLVRADNQPDTCGNPKKICELQVLNKGKTIFIDQGVCPGMFSVQCGDCPEGTMRCECSGYPGFCCISCNELKQGIRGITNYVKGLNNG